MPRRLSVALATLLGTVLGAVVLASAASADGTGSEAARPGAAAPHASNVVLIGVPGLEWADLSATRSPVMWHLAQEGAVASLSVRTIGTRTCPLDGWLTVSAGSRAAYPHVPCGSVPGTLQHQAGSWQAPVVRDARRVNLRSDFRAAVGSLGDAAHRAGATVAAIGPGAAIAAADSSGRFDAYAPDPVGFRGWGRYRITLVDLEDVVRPYLGAGGRTGPAAAVGAGARAAAVRRADTAAGAVLAALPAGTDVIVAGISDEAATPHLRAVVARGPAFATGHLLRSPSTRRDGLTILPDLTATVLTAAGLPVPAPVTGTPWTTGAVAGDLAGTARDLRGQDVAAQTVRATLPAFFAAFVACQMLVYLLAFLAMRGAAGSRRRLLAVARIPALAGASVPVSTYLVDLFPWWRAARPAPVLFAGVVAVAALLTAVALGGPWRRDVMAPGTIVAGVTAVVAGADLACGSPLQMNSLMGYSPLVGGRYYGLGNIAFATFATGTLFLAGGIAHVLLSRGRRAWAVAAVVALGALADMTSGLPGLGAKFGGTIALVPGTAVAAMMVAGRRVTALRVLPFAALGVATVAAICGLDYLRPPGRRTHLGRFAGQVLHGDAVPVVSRKLHAMLHTVGNIPLTLLAVGGLLFLFVVLLRDRGTAVGGAALAPAYERAPALRAALAATLVTSMSGFAVEDSGIAVPAIALTLAVPLAFAAGARARVAADEATAAPTADGIPSAREPLAGDRTR